MFDKRNQQFISSGDHSINAQTLFGDIQISNSNIPAEFVDEKINEQVDILRKSRFFDEFDRVAHSLELATKITDGNLSGGSNEERGRALAWCSRLLFRTNESDKAEEFLKIAGSLGNLQEIKIAGAFLESQKGNRNLALSILAEIKLPVSRTAALMVVAHHDGSQGALDWFKESGTQITDIDSEGKYVLLIHLLLLDQLEYAEEIVEEINKTDLQETPVLHHVIAMIYLLSTVPNDLRRTVLNQLPSDAALLQLASDNVSIQKRRQARQHFNAVAKYAQKCECFRSSSFGEEYALWLDLRDPDYFERGKRQLEEKLNDSKTALRFVPLGFQFNIKLGDYSTSGTKSQRN